MIYKRKSQSGIALVYVLMLVLAFTTLMAITYKMTNQALEQSGKELYDTQAFNVARDGTQDAFAWFTRQATIVQRVGVCTSPIVAPPQGNYSDAYFAPTPRLNASSIGDTDDSTVGIVRDIIIDPTNKIYGHYEVKKQVLNNEFPGYEDKNDRDAVHDITHLKKITPNRDNRGEGLIWRITSTGYAYVRGDTGRNAIGVFTDKCCTNMIANTKNRVLAKKIVSAEFDRFNLVDKKAAILVNSSSNVTAADTSSVISPSADILAVCVKSVTGPAVLSGNMSMIANNFPLAQRLTVDPALDLSTDAIFGMTRDVLINISDKHPTSVTSDVFKPNERLKGSLIFVDGNASFTNPIPLRGSGILIVKGALDFAENSGSFFSGMIYLEAGGSLTIRGGYSISGAVVVANGNVNISSSGDISTIEYSAGSLNAVRNKLANYRLNNLSFKVVQ